ncbi:TPA_asm: maturation protein [ssRNA phage Gerhypos.3_24]|uniref:Maturation protein n=2 Tax=Leviviricetes TaxID=2842243 RepID=A0A8S5L4C9_9VIRU|nr:maturation protein [ssRNA phage Gerhypos.3_24]QDH86943.1 MAG: hypothetical protein H3Bulk42342_000003 [Leviviridae sp.]DAD52197.1 TPA_asm: maturation protein [ssRNA phage Gerhypos.3_24]
MPDKTNELIIVEPLRPVLGRSGVSYISVPQQGVPLLLTEGDVANPQHVVHKEYRYVHGDTHEGPPYKEGGDFLQYTMHYPVDILEGSAYTETWTAPRLGYFFSPTWPGHGWYQGGFILPSTYGVEGLGDSERILYDQITESYVNPGNLQELGNRAYNRLRPKIEQAGVFTAAYELKDLPGMLQTSVGGMKDIYRTIGGDFRNPLLGPKAVADHFLNHEFGWVPLVQDIQKTIKVAHDFDKYVSDAKSRNGKWAKRRFREPHIEEEHVEYQTSGASTFVYPSLGDTYISSGKFTVTRQRMTDTWYTGRFMQYFPEFDTSFGPDDMLTQLEQGLDLYGARMSPINLYRITPWTWMIDWFAGAGDLVQRATDIANGSTYAEAFYLMRHCYERWEFKSEFTDHLGNTQTLVWYRSIEVKRREKAKSMFGFSANPAGLSDMQKAILGALGISRAF